MSTTSAPPLPSATAAIAAVMSEGEPRTKAPRLEDTVEEMRRQQETMMKMFIETNKNIHESIKLANLAIQSTNDLAQNISHGQNWRNPARPNPDQQGLPPHQIEAISNAWTTAAAVSVVEGAASHAATNAVKMMKVPSPKLPDAVHKGIERVAQIFLKDVRKYSRSVKAFDDASKKLTVMLEDQDHQRYPPGIRPFASSTTFVELDEMFSKTTQDAHNLSFSIPTGTSRRDAMRMIHHFFTSQIRSIELEALAAHRDSLNAMATKEVLISRCKTAVDEIVARDADLRNLSIDSPNRLVVDDALFKTKVEEHYTHIVKKVVEEINKSEEKKTKERDKEEKDKEEFAKQRPENLLKDLVNHMVNEQVQKHKVHMPYQVEVDPEDAEMPPSDEIGHFDENATMSKLVTAFKGKGPKNGKSPGAAPGEQQQHAMGAGKGKSKPSVPLTGKHSHQHAQQQTGKQHITSKSRPQTHNANGQKGKKGSSKKGPKEHGKKGGKKGKNYGGKK